MIKIAFCDDEISVLNEMRIFLDQYRSERNYTIDYIAFHSPFNLLTEIERGIHFDIIFLDILMPGETGISAAAEIRKYDNNVKIIFLTSSSEFAVESYNVNAFFYQLKPLQKGQLFQLMDSVVSSLKKEQTQTLLLRCKNGITRIDLAQLEYCEVIHRTLFIYLTNGTVLESIGHLNDLYMQLLPYGGFLRPHRSYLINLEHIQNLSYNKITMTSSAQIPIPRGKYQEIKDAYLEYAFQNRQVMI